MDQAHRSADRQAAFFNSIAQEKREGNDDFEKWAGPPAGSLRRGKPENRHGVPGGARPEKTFLGKDPVRILRLEPALWYIQRKKPARKAGKGPDALAGTGERRILDGQMYQMEEILPGVDRRSRFILCRDPAGRRFVCPEEVWSGEVLPGEGPAGSGASEPVSRPGAPVAPTQSGLTREQKLKRRIDLFRTRFQGRRDVYAQRFESQTSGKKGYSFACGNRWSPGLCDLKKGKKCSAACPNRRFLAMTDEVIEAHLLGKDETCGDVLGAYPLEEGDTTRFLALDLDEGDWREDVKALRETCREIGVVPAVERSRSGDGAHVWFFFAGSVPAEKARRFGSGLLTRTMARRHELSFDSYDRMFPSQDTLPKGGLGNLIALPLQGRARKKGNSMFIDEEFVPYGNQWAYLAGLPLLTGEQLEAYLLQLGGDTDLGELTPVEESGDGKPLPGRRAPRILRREDFPPQVRVGLSSMVFVEKAGLSQAAMNAVRRLAVMRNPEYVRRQRLRIPMNSYGKIDTPRIFDCGYEDEDFLGVPRGCRPALEQMLRSAGVPYQIRDERTSGRPIRVSFTGELRPDQVPAAQALLERETGILQAPPAFGKTVTAAWLIAQRKVSTLILVDSNALQEQWKKSLEEFLEISEPLPEEAPRRGRKKKRSAIGQLGAGRETRSGIVDIANLQSMSEKEESEAERVVKSFIGEYGMILMDECHHAAARTYERVLNAAPARYIHGLTATPIRKDGMEPILFMQLGPVVFRHKGEGDGLLRFVVPRFTKLRMGENAVIYDAYEAMISHEERNRQILADALAAVERGRTPVLLTERREHARRLVERLEGKVDHVILLWGSDSGKEKRARLETLRAVPAEESLVLVATGRYAGEGFDLPRLDTLLLTMPISWKGTLEQYVGRLHRLYEGKKETVVFDYVDAHVPMLERMYRKRLHAYGEMKYRVWSGQPEAIVSRIFSGEDWREPFREDLGLARKSVRIVSPRLSESTIQALLPSLRETAAGGVAVKVHTRRPEDGRTRKAASDTSACIRMLKEAGVSVETDSRYCQCCAVLDGQVVWHGSVCFLGPRDEEDSTFRFENPEVAGDLLDAMEEYRRGEVMEQLSLQL